MADYSASALDALKRKIALHAIEWSMIEAEWYGRADRGFQGGGFDVMLPPVTGPTGTVRLKLHISGYSRVAQPPPGCRYVGEEVNELGMLLYVYEMDPWTDLYEPWLERIEDAFTGWESLPDPADFEGPIDSVRQAVIALTPLPSGSGGDFGTDFASVDLASNLDLLDDWINPATSGANTSAMLYAFDAQYGAGRITALLQNQAQAAIILGVALVGERNLWERTRADIMTLAEQAVEAFDPARGGGGAFPFTVVKAFLGLLNTFVPAPIKPAIAVGTSALSLVESLLPPEESSEVESQISGGTVEELYASLGEAIRKLDSTVFDQEYELVGHTLQGLLDEMRGGPASQFHIHPDAGMAPELTGAQVIDLRTDYIKLIGYQTVPQIAAVMGKAAEQAQAADKPSIWERSGLIGYGTSGPYSRWSEVLAQFDAVTTGSGKELVEAGRLLAVGAGFLEDVDGYTQDALRGVADDLARGEAGWDNRHVGYTPPPPRPTPGRPTPY